MRNEYWTQTQENTHPTAPSADTSPTPDLRTHPVHWDDANGGSVAFLPIGGNKLLGLHLVEIPAGKALAPHRHMFEEIIIVVAGSGKTTVWNPGGERVTCQWKENSMFSIPLNAWHQHECTDPSTPARYLALTDQPMQRRLFDSDDYLFGSDFVFRDRFDGEPAYFDGMVKDLGHYKGGGTAMRTNFVPDLMSLSLRSRPIRGAETTGGGIDFPNCRHLAVHLNEYPPGYGPLTHRHRNEALIYWLHGSGYSEVWKNFEGPRDRLQWHAKQVVAPPTFWYHRHQLDQDTGARLVAVTTNKFQFQTNYWEIEGGPNSGLG